MRGPVAGQASMAGKELSYGPGIMLRLVLADTHLPMLCHREGGRRIGLIVLVGNWGGIPDRGRRAIKSGLIEGILDTLNEAWLTIS